MADSASSKLDGPSKEAWDRYLGPLQVGELTRTAPGDALKAYGSGNRLVIDTLSLRNWRMN